MSIQITIELANSLDIHVSQMIGLLQNPQYRSLVNEYELDTTQCMLWWEISQMLAVILSENDYEDLELNHLQFGLAIKQVLAENLMKYTYVKYLLDQYDALDKNALVGKIVKETMEDIEIIYSSIQKDLAEVFSTQKEIQKMVKNGKRH